MAGLPLLRGSTWPISIRYIF